MSIEQLPKGHVSGLDGLRALAIIAVVLYHADFAWMQGGFLGVDLFFVLSGFLITGLLANEHAASGRIRLRGFFWRRARRLLPAAWLMMACVTLAAAHWAPDALTRLRHDLLASFFYVTNWELLRADVSYFEGMGRQPLLMHLWSLAIEEQFYIVWACVVAFGLRALRRSWLAVVALLGAAASAWWMWQVTGNGLHDGPVPNASRAYFGTDTHGFQLLIGAALGLLWNPHGRRAGEAHWSMRLLLWIGGLGALGTLIAGFVLLGENHARLYPWGFLVVGVASALLVLCASHPGAALGRLLDVAPLRWIGNRAYGIYLWHWPVAMLMRPGIDFPAIQDQWLVVGRIALPVLLAALSYAWVERPIRNGAIERAWQAFLDAGSSFALGMKTAFAMMLALAMLSLAGHALLRTPESPALAADVQALFEPPAVAAAAAATAMPAPASASEPALRGVAAVPEPPLPTAPDAESFAGGEVSAVGDSVLLGSRWWFERLLNRVDIHAEVGWQAADVITQIKALRARSALRPVVVLHMGTNGYVYEGQLRSLLRLLADRKRVILVNSSVPRRWMTPNNALMERVAPDYPNVLVIHWNALSEGQRQYFVSDGVHLTPQGQRRFIAAIMQGGGLSNATPARVPSDDLRVAAKVPAVSAPSADPVSTPSDVTAGSGVPQGAVQAPLSTAPQPSSSPADRMP